VDSGQFKGWADLKGKKVAISSTDNSAEVFVDHVMRSVGLSIKDVDNPILGYPDQGPGFVNKAIDAGQTIEPFATQYVEKGFAVIPPDKETIYKGFQAAVVMYGPKFIADKPDVGKRLMVAYLRGVRDYNVAFTKGTNKDAVIQSLINHTSVKDRALYDKMGLPGLNPDGPPNDQDLAGQQDFFLARGYQKEKLDLKPVLDHSFTEYAVGQLGKFSA
jgi:ABC-type nitrate/sulfonate/bicarbonate transport system substrate-binding protein